MNITGRYLGHFADHGFLYAYTCPCGRTFRSGAPELSAPALCHACYTGNQDALAKAARREKRRRKRRG
jgi:hypothetical protein